MREENFKFMWIRFGFLYFFLFCSNLGLSLVNICGIRFGFVVLWDCFGFLCVVVAGFGLFELLLGLFRILVPFLWWWWSGKICSCGVLEKSRFFLMCLILRKKRKLWIRVLMWLVRLLLLFLGSVKKKIDSLFIGCQILGSLVHCND